MMTPSDDFFWDRLKPPNSLYRGGELLFFFFFRVSLGILVRIPVPLYLQHLETIILVFTWYLHDFAVLMLVG